jgi:hypothetical protein
MSGARRTISTTRAEVELQARDLAILQALFESRLMTLNHITHLFFDGHSEAAKKRVQQLKAHRYIRERARRVYQPSILHLSRRSFAALSERGMLLEYPQLAWNQLEDRANVSESTLKHEIQVVDVKTAFSRAITTTPHYELIEFLTWPLLYQFWAAQPVPPGAYHGTRVLVKPDGFMRIHEKAPEENLFEHFLFLEVDRSTESRETLARRAFGYQDFYRQGGLAIRYGATEEAYKEFPFRVLMVFLTEERRNNMAERLLQNDPPVLSMVWLTTFAEVIANPLGAIWMRPLDYREITKGTQYDPSRPRTGAYRREPAREAMVAGGLRKLRLFEE